MASANEQSSLILDVEHGPARNKNKRAERVIVALFSLMILFQKDIFK